MVSTLLPCVPSPPGPPLQVVPTAEKPGTYVSLAPALAGPASLLSRLQYLHAPGSEWAPQHLAPCLSWHPHTLALC